MQTRALFGCFSSCWPPCVLLYIQHRHASWSSVQHIANLDFELEVVKATFVEFDKTINESLKHNDMAYDGDKPSLKNWSDMNSDALFVEDFQISTLKLVYFLGFCQLNLLFLAQKFSS